MASGRLDSNEDNRKITHQMYTYNFPKVLDSAIHIIGDIFLSLQEHLSQL